MGIKTKRTVVREAAGVVGAITPWNFPHQINFAKLGPAFAAGNTSCSNRRPTPPGVRPGRPVIAEETDIPAGRRQHCHLDRPPSVRSSPTTPGSTRLVHRFHRHRQDVMAAASRPSSGCSSNSAGSRRFSSLTTPTSPGPAAMAAFSVAMHAGQGCAITTRLLVPRERYAEAVAATCAAAWRGCMPAIPTNPGRFAGR